MLELGDWWRQGNTNQSPSSFTNFHRHLHRHPPYSSSSTHLHQLLPPTTSPPFQNFWLGQFQRFNIPEAYRSEGGSVGYDGIWDVVKARMSTPFLGLSPRDIPRRFPMPAEKWREATQTHLLHRHPPNSSPSTLHNLHQLLLPTNSPFSRKLGHFKKFPGMLTQPNYW